MENLLARVDIGQDLGSPLGQPGRELGNLISLLVTGSITIAGIIILFMFLYGGFKIIAGAGSSDPKSTQGGKQAVTYAIIGFIIVFTAYWIIRLIEIITNSRFITLGPIST